MANRRFEVGHSYLAADSGIPPIKVLKRTAKMILVENGGATWRMLIRAADDGDEYVIDSSIAPAWRGVLTYQARWEVHEH